ncbi:hypothetical protein [Phenylobacterium sp.]|uniref:hypothetical protein n=1 Tax=Phenylobacterium sp. TaxID=1871053 RepID=UPI0012065C8F|nr:hypothetical protein [Phenylobacterium sp.]THD58558.1 MAG: hypothetical protein E8A49_18715 [Phenylobacterium sp.]
MQISRIIQRLIKIARWVITALLVLELLLVYGLGSMLGGALGEADDAKGPILLVGPISVVVALLVAWRFKKRASAWALALVVLSAPMWASISLGPASETNLRPFWGEALAVALWPAWGLLGFGLAARMAIRRDINDRFPPDPDDRGARLPALPELAAGR